MIALRIRSTSSERRPAHLEIAELGPSAEDADDEMVEIRLQCVFAVRRKSSFVSLDEGLLGDNHPLDTSQKIEQCPVRPGAHLCEEAGHLWHCVPHQASFSCAADTAYHD